jgi:hypothetical protein
VQEGNTPKSIHFWEFGIPRCLITLEQGLNDETFSILGPLEIIEKDLEKHTFEIGLHPQFGNKKKQVKWLIK